MRSQAIGTSTIIPTPTAPENPYQPLGDYLTQRWQQVGPDVLAIRCAPRGGRLLVLVEHVITVQPNLTVTFERIKDLLEAAPPEVWTAQSSLSEPPAQLGVNMFIRVINQKQSYGECEWEIVPLKQFLGDSRIITPAQSSSALARIPAVTTQAGNLQTGNAQTGNAQNGNAQTGDETKADADREATLEALESDLNLNLNLDSETDLDLDLDADDRLDWSGEVAIDPEMAAAFSPEHLRLEPLPGAESDPVHGAHRPGAGAATGRYDFGHSDSETYNSGTYNSETYSFESDESESDEFETDETEDRLRVPVHIPRSVWAAGLGLCLMTFVASFYVASRPCWFRSCAPLTLAQQHGQDVNAMLQVASTWNDLEQDRKSVV